MYSSSVPVLGEPLRGGLRTDLVDAGDGRPVADEREVVDDPFGRPELRLDAFDVEHIACRVKARCGTADRGRFMC